MEKVGSCVWRAKKRKTCNDLDRSVLCPLSCKICESRQKRLVFECMSSEMSISMEIAHFFSRSTLHQTGIGRQRVPFCISSEDFVDVCKLHIRIHSFFLLLSCCVAANRSVFRSFIIIFMGRERTDRCCGFSSKNDI